MIQNTVKDEYRGRVMSLFTLMLVGTSPVGSFLLGTVAERAGAPVAIAIGGTGCILGAFWVVHRLRILAQREVVSPDLAMTRGDSAVPADETEQTRGETAQVS